MKDGGRVKDREIKQKRPTQRNRERQIRDRDIVRGCYTERETESKRKTDRELETETM